MNPQHISEYATPQVFESAFFFRRTAPFILLAALLVPSLGQVAWAQVATEHQCRHGMGTGHPSGRPGANPSPSGHHHASGPQVQLEHAMQQEVSNDLAAITLFAEFKDRDAGTASQKATVALNAALAKLASDSALSDRRSQLQTWVDYGPDGKTLGWKSRAELTLESKDFAALGKAAGRVAPEFATAGFSYRLSHEARQQEEQKLITRAIAAWRDKAATIVSALGFSGHDPVDVQVRTSSAGEGGGVPMTRMAMPMMMASSAEGAAPAMEPGKSRVSVTVTGSVRPR